MEKEIRIKIKSVRYEVGESLFTELVNDDEMDISMLGDIEPDPEVIEINTFGKKKTEDGRIDISYEESEVTGMDGSTTSISYDTSARGMISMIREGAVSTVLILRRGRGITVFIILLLCPLRFVFILLRWKIILTVLERFLLIMLLR